MPQDDQEFSYTPRQHSALNARFKLLTDTLRSDGALAGTAHKRIVIPKDKLTEADLNHLGFQPVRIAIPEAGQDRFQSFRHPDNLFHVHSHPEGWTMHEDAHPSSTMLAVRAKGKLNKAKALLGGTAHVSEEGLPGLAYYLKGRLSGHASTAQSVLSELPAATKRRLERLRPSASYVMQQGRQAGNYVQDKVDTAMRELDKMASDSVVHRAFLDELQKIAEANGGVLPGLEKMALSFTPITNAAKGLMGGATRATNPFKGGPGVFQRFGQDLMAGGKMLGQNSTKSLVAGSHVAAGPAGRVAGELAHSMGHHYAHKSTLMNAINPLGGAIGGLAEGATRAAGKEMVRGGAAMGANGARGLGAASKAMGGVGRGLQAAAKPMGMAGEVAGLAGLGTALHAPLSVAGVVGGKILGGAAHAAPAIGDALHSAGATLAHGAHDVVGNIAHGSVDRARKAMGLTRVPVKAPVTGYSMMPPPLQRAA